MAGAATAAAADCSTVRCIQGGYITCKNYPGKKLDGRPVAETAPEQAASENYSPTLSWVHANRLIKNLRVELNRKRRKTVLGNHDRDPDLTQEFSDAATMRCHCQPRMALRDSNGGTLAASSLRISWTSNGCCRGWWPLTAASSRRRLSAV
uniref:Uncharacterized protein n=1 Tax=Oryza glumipatula TaxID=40148 RepID=A0A0D9ZCR0_9ORYZ